LVVDDDDSVRLTLVANLDLDGFHVADVATAEAALALLDEETFDVVLSDVRMPGMGGVGLVTELRNRHPEVPVVMMTAFSNEESIAGAYGAGVFTVLRKPFDVEHVVRTLQRALRRPIVLIIDDIETVASTTVDALRSIGLRATAAFDGRSALEVVREESVDVCVTDLVMPEMSGIELFAHLRAEDPEIAVIVCSGVNESEGMMRDAASSGAYRCLRKPIEPSLLARVIASARGEGAR
jgi:DNA-binding NtrC family response regulator